MARGRRVDLTVIALIENTWAEWPKLPATEVLTKVKGRVKEGSCPKLRKVQQVIRGAKQRARPIPSDPPLVPWGPDWPTAPDDIRCLYRLTLCSLVERGWPLSAREGRWAIKLRSLFAVTGLAPVAEFEGTAEHLAWAAAFARRERAADILGMDVPYTADLDGVMMFRAYESRSRADYEEAVKIGLVPGWSETTDIAATELWLPGFAELYRRFIS